MRQESNFLESSTPRTVYYRGATGFEHSMVKSPEWSFSCRKILSMDFRVLTGDEGINSVVWVSTWLVTPISPQFTGPRFLPRLKSFGVPDTNSLVLGVSFLSNYEPDVFPVYR